MKPPQTAAGDGKVGDPPPENRSSTGALDRRAPREVDSASLLQGQTALQIRHQGEVYRLQVTRQGKLILTK